MRGGKRNPITLTIWLIDESGFRALGKGWGETLGKKTGTTAATPSFPLLVFPFLSLPPLVFLPRDWWLVLQRYSLQLFLWGSHWVDGANWRLNGNGSGSSRRRRGLSFKQKKNRKNCSLLSIFPVSLCFCVWASAILSVDVISLQHPVMHIWLLNGNFAHFNIKPHIKS